MSAVDPTPFRQANPGAWTGAGYISAHRTQSGGILKLIKFAARIGIDVDDYHVGTGKSETLSDHPEVASYAVMRLPIEN